MFSIDADFGAFEKWMRMMERREEREVFISKFCVCVWDGAHIVGLSGLLEKTGEPNAEASWLFCRRKEQEPKSWTALFIFFSVLGTGEAFVLKC
jgi:hypothetical protein